MPSPDSLAGLREAIAETFQHTKSLTNTIGEQRVQIMRLESEVVRLTVERNNFRTALRMDLLEQKQEEIDRLTEENDRLNEELGLLRETIG